jgi:hypothetical protein
MNLCAMLNRGIANSGVEARKKAQFAREMEAVRAKWLDALMVDETRAWMSIGEVNHQTLSGLVAMLTLAGLCEASGAKNKDGPAVRVIRGAISAAQQCAAQNKGISAQHAQAFSSAAKQARAIFERCSHVDLIYAAEHLDQTMQAVSLATQSSGEALCK